VAMRRRCARRMIAVVEAQRGRNDIISWGMGWRSRKAARRRSESVGRLGRAALSFSYSAIPQFDLSQLRLNSRLGALTENIKGELS
jgi:hypothetical protein